MRYNCKVKLLHSIKRCYISVQSSESDSAHSSPMPQTKMPTLTKVAATAKDFKDTTERQQHDGDLKPKESNIQKVNTYWVIIDVFSI